MFFPSSFSPQIKIFNSLNVINELGSINFVPISLDKEHTKSNHKNEKNHGTNNN
jgi:hypothetical protein